MPDGIHSDVQGISGCYILEENWKGEFRNVGSEADPISFVVLDDRPVKWFTRRWSGGGLESTLTLISKWSEMHFHGKMWERGRGGLTYVPLYQEHVWGYDYLDQTITDREDIPSSFVLIEYTNHSLWWKLMSKYIWMPTKGWTEWYHQSSRLLFSNITIPSSCGRWAVNMKDILWTRPTGKHMNGKSGLSFCRSKNN